jgi:uncharacterized membrane protein
MITATRGALESGRRFVLDPSESPVSPTLAMVVFLLVSAGILSGAVTLWLFGIWQVMPMSVLVLIAVGAGLLNGYFKTQLSDVVAIVGDHVAIDKHSYRADRRYEFQRGWAQVVIEEPPASRPNLSHLYIRCHDRKVEIGAFLDDHERRDLATLLRSLMGPTRSFDAASAG